LTDEQSVKLVQTITVKCNLTETTEARTASMYKKDNDIDTL
jgi:hypothetical protein